MARILHHVTVVRDGMHNGFTDLQHWQGCHWVAYRKGSGHISMDSEAIVAVGSDRTRFREVARLRVPGDNRDPKLLPISDDRMAAYFPSWTHGVAAQTIQHYIAFTHNGYDWTTPEPILEPNQWLWRIRPHDGRYFGLIQTLTNPHPDQPLQHNLDLAVSDDLLHWETLCRIGTDAQALCESDIHWWPTDEAAGEAAGEAWIVARSATTKKTGGNDFFCSAKPPYTDWQITELPARVHAPIFMEHDGELYVAGRRFPEVEGDRTFISNATLGIYRVTRGHVELVLHIPATGDCTYPGFIKDADGRICLSYYSQHAYHTGVHTQPARMFAGYPEPLAANDVYFAELELP